MIRPKNFCLTARAPMIPEYLTTSQAAKIFHVTRFTIRNWIIEGKLKANSTLGGHHRIPRTAILHLLRKTPTGHLPLHKTHDTGPEGHTKSCSIAASVPQADARYVMKKRLLSFGKQVGAIQKRFSKILTQNTRS